MGKQIETILHACILGKRHHMSPLNLHFVDKAAFNYLLVAASAPQKSLGEEVNELTSSRLLKLEKDNQTLQKTVEELRGGTGSDSVGKLGKVGQENQRLNQKVSNVVVIPWRCTTGLRHWSNAFLRKIFLLIFTLLNRNCSFYSDTNTSDGWSFDLFPHHQKYQREKSRKYLESGRKGPCKQSRKSHLLGFAFSFPHSVTP